MFPPACQRVILIVCLPIWLDGVLSRSSALEVVPGNVRIVFEQRLNTFATEIGGVTVPLDGVAGPDGRMHLAAISGQVLAVEGTTAELFLDLNTSAVDGTDFLEIQRTAPVLISQWQTHYGEVFPRSLHGKLVPEPESILLVGVLLAIGLFVSDPRL